MKRPSPFQDFSLTLEAGCHLTLTGRTGSGKSTLFKLITGLYLPDSGTIALFGMNPAAIPPKERRKIFGIVSQSFPMIDGTVRDQITLGDMRITDTMTASALRISGLYETVMALPQKLDTPFQDSLFLKEKNSSFPLPGPWYSSRPSSFWMK